MALGRECLGHQSSNRNRCDFRKVASFDNVMERIFRSRQRERVRARYCEGDEGDEKGEERDEMITRSLLSLSKQ